MDSLREFWHNLTVPHSSDEQEARLEYMAKAILVTLITAISVSTISLLKNFSDI